MKTMTMTLLAALAATALPAQELTTPLTVSDVTITQLKKNQDVVVTYKLANGGDPALVLLDILTNSVSIGIEKIKTVEGDISTTPAKFIAEGTHTITWKARTDWRGNLASNVQAHVLAYYTNNAAYLPGVYMVIDLSKGTSATAADPYPVNYTFTAPEVNYLNRTTNLWLRHIEPGTFMMGAQSESEYAGIETDSRHLSEVPQHKVTLTQPFFAGVFELTQKQYELVVGSVPSPQMIVGASYPVGKVSYTTLRGSAAGCTNWPSSHRVDDGTFFKLLRERTNFALFDLPTEAQWEYACRAGTATQLYNGYDLTNNTADAHADEIGWYSQSFLHLGGLKKPNAWGLYDMVGNMREICLDRIGVYAANSVEDPVGSSEGTAWRIIRSAALDDKAFRCRSSMRMELTTTEAFGNVGLRVFLTLD